FPPRRRHCPLAASRKHQGHSGLQGPRRQPRPPGPARPPPTPGPPARTARSPPARTARSPPDRTHSKGNAPDPHPCRWERARAGVVALTSLAAVALRDGGEGGLGLPGHVGVGAAVTARVEDLDDARAGQVQVATGIAAWAVRQAVKREEE